MIRPFIASLFLLAAVASPRVSAAGLTDQVCWDQAAAYHGVDPWLLYAIAYTESTHNPNAVSRPNRNGTYDIGLMQINSVHIPTLRAHGIDPSSLKNACASTYIGAWVLSSKIRRYGYTWQAIAAYNVGSLDTPARIRVGQAYAKKVYSNYDRLVAGATKSQGQGK